MPLTSGDRDIKPTLEVGSLEFYLDQIPDEFAQLEAAIKEVFKTGTEGGLTASRVEGWIKEMNDNAGAGSRSGLTGADLEDQIRDDIAQHVITKEVFMSFYGVSAEEAEQIIVGGNEGGTNFSDLSAPGSEPKGVLGGGDLVRVNRDDGSSFLALRYVYNGIEHLYSFDSDEQAIKALGSTSGAIDINEDTVDQLDGDTWLLGDALGFVGQEGTYVGYFENVMQEAALEAGVMNPGKIGEYFSQPEVQRIIAEGEAGDWGTDRIQAALRSTEYYQTVLYPGILNIMESGEGGNNPEAVWMEYAKSVENSLDKLGYERDDDGSFASRVGEMLDKGITDDAFKDASGIFIRAEQNPQFADVLNQWVEAEGLPSLEFTDIFDVLEGTTDPELEAIVEKAIIQFQAEATGFSLDPSQVTRLANLTQFSEAQIQTGFSAAENQLLALAGRGELYGLDESALVSAAFNLDSASGTANETRRLARKAILERGLSDDRQAQFFGSFDSSGKPFRPGLQPGAPERG